MQGESPPIETVLSVFDAVLLASGIFAALLLALVSRAFWSSAISRLALEATSLGDLEQDVRGGGLADSKSAAFELPVKLPQFQTTPFHSIEVAFGLSCVVTWSCAATTVRSVSVGGRGSQERGSATVIELPWLLPESKSLSSLKRRPFPAACDILGVIQIHSIDAPGAPRGVEAAIVLQHTPPRLLVIFRGTADEIGNWGNVFWTRWRGLSKAEIAASATVTLRGPRRLREDSEFVWGKCCTR